MTKPWQLGQSVTVNLADLWFHEYHCEACEESSFVAVEIVGIQACHRCGALLRRVSDEPFRAVDL